MKKLYLDMDGVLANFTKRYKELFGVAPGSNHDDKRDRKEFTKNWNVFVHGGNFETLEMLPSAKTLLDYVDELHKKHGIQVEILSSSGGEKFHGEVTVEKIKWLRKNGIPYKANIVAGRKKKKEFATPNSVLIDDTPDVIEDFNDAGGIGILHDENNVQNTLVKLKSLVDKSAK